MNSAGPRVSVISTVHNGEPYFDRAVPSILGQTYRSFEYIILDDGSTDRTSELLSELANQDHRVSVFSPGRIGRAEALNCAVKSARGEYVANQDFDDISYPERLRAQVEFLDANPEVGLVGSYYVVIDDNRQECFIRMPPTVHHELIQAMAKYIPFAHTLVMFRKKAWAQAGGYPKVDDAEDLRLWVAVARIGWELANIPEVLGEHWIHPDSFWHQNFKYRERQKKQAHVHWQAVHELDLPLRTRVYPLGMYIYAYLPTTLKRLVRRTLGGSQEKDFAHRNGF